MGFGSRGGGRGGEAGRGGGGPAFSGRGAGISSLRCHDLSGGRGNNDGGRGGRGGGRFGGGRGRGRKVLNRNFMGGGGAGGDGAVQNNEKVGMH